jgi:arabinose-5-phosphate isomerase
MTKKFIPLAKKVIDLEIQALQKLKKKIDNSFNKAVVEIAKCKSKVILCGVGKSGLIAAKISATLSSFVTPYFNLSARDSSHGDLGSISKKDILILISYSGKTSELKNIIQYANRNKIMLIGIMSKRDSILYRASDIKLLIPEVKESGGIVPTSSTTAQLALGDALAISTMHYRKFGKFDFKKIHPAGNLGSELRTVEDLMLKGDKIPFVGENLNMRSAIKILSNKKLGILIIQNKQKKSIGIITDGQIRRYNEKRQNINEVSVVKIMTKHPISIDKDSLAAKALALMNEKKITSLCVYNKKNKQRTIGVIHIHNILKSKIS